ncbi:dihydrolipoamide acetyltransferase family protein [Nocardioides sp. CER19]|uniref:dihydrolipoamide acetyltransferase family protein n=1 Tax=Nocardioides sp. CER19 TaxID=3038538 RepID=UPI00244C1D17|nr:dihydrolipoamide acetyltransferase family protein [Nocardioides sp. CER19]MDH2412526.1 dihydrolipoamide acetyltransferase family protein [Nocardioides sp. CER19]
MTSAAGDQTFLLPDLGEGLTEAEVVHWLVAEGDIVTVDQTVVEVETAKSVVEVPTPYAGRVLTLHAAEGETVDVGKPLITVAAGARTDPAPEPAGGREAQAYREEEQAGSGNVLIGYGTAAHGGAVRRRRPRTTERVVSAPATRGPVRVISPMVRKMARDHGVDLHRVEPTGYRGIVTKADVERAIAGAPPAAPPPVAEAAPVAGERRIPLSGFRKTVAAALSRSRSEIPEATVWVDVDATALWNLRESARTATDAGPGLLAYIARFVVAGLKEHPVLNARLDTERDEIVEYDAIDLGLAVQGERGLVVPAVIGADTMTTAELDRAIRHVTARARVGKATAEELAAGTFTLNNYGGFRVDGSAAIINHPQVAILGFGRIIDRPWVVDGQIVPRKITQMSFVFDHRVCDGGTAAGFMRSVADAIENPASAIARL